MVTTMNFRQELHTRSGVHSFLSSAMQI